MQGWGVQMTHWDLQKRTPGVFGMMWGVSILGPLKESSTASIIGAVPHWLYNSLCYVFNESLSF